MSKKLQDWPPTEFDPRDIESVAAIKAAREQYWTVGGIACEAIFVSHETLRHERDRLQAELDRIKRKEPHPSHEWCGPNSLESCVLCGYYKSSHDAIFECSRRLEDKKVPCCECGEDYPEPDLNRGHVFCPKCRKQG